MTAYLVAVVHITQPEVFEAARRAASSATGDYGARFLARGSAALQTLQVVEGKTSPDHVTVIEYPSIEHVQRWLASDEYLATRAQRANAAEFSLFLLPGL